MVRTIPVAGHPDHPSGAAARATAPAAQARGFDQGQRGFSGRFPSGS